ncbi:MAG TPA: hypothetical protein ENH82_12000 [bacterium]|nr:hypothetical protein [bacterium]
MRLSVSHKGNMSTRKNETLRALKEIWDFYEGEKLAYIEFLRGEHGKEDYFTGDGSKQRQKEADEAEMYLDSKRAFMKQAKKYIRKCVA